MRVSRNRSAVIVVMMMTLVGLFGGMPAASAAPGDFATVTVIHGIPGTTVDIEIDSDLVLDDFEPESVSMPQVLTAATHSVEVLASDGLSTVIAPQDFDLAGGGNFTIVAHLDAAGDPVLTAFQNSYEPVDSGMSEIVVRHTAEAAAVDVLDSADDSVIVSDLSNAEEDAAMVPAGSYDLAVVATGTTEPVVIEGSVDLIEQSKYYVYAIGSTTDDTLTLLVVPWDGFTGDVVFQATLMGSNEVPAVDADGAGLATFRIDEEGTGEIAYSIFVYGVTDISGGHLHLGVEGESGGVVVDLLAGVTTPVSTDGLLVKGSITPEDLVEVTDQGYDGSFVELTRLFRVDPSALYVNIETDANPSGEIRGQVEPLDVPEDSRFVDTADSVHAVNIDLIAAAGITRGCNPPDNTEYCPQSSITRGQMAAFLRRAFNLPASSTEAFTDDATSEFEGDIDAIAAFGITAGCNPPDNDQYCPDDPITRGQMAAFLKRAFGLAASDADQFTDDDDSVFEGDIDAIFEAGITQGCNPPTNDRYCPDDEVTREQMASFLARALGWGF